MQPDTNSSPFKYSTLVNKGFGVNIENFGFIGVNQIKTNKYFIVSKNTIVGLPDKFPCSEINGTEIIIYNNGTKSITITYNINSLHTLVSKTNMQLTYIDALSKWIII